MITVMASLSTLDGLMSMVLAENNQQQQYMDETGRFSKWKLNVSAH